MEFTTIIILGVILVYFTKNAKGKEIVNNVGDTAVHLSAAANKASEALERQCNEPLMSDEEAASKAKAAKAKIAKASKAKTVDNYDDAE